MIPGWFESPESQLQITPVSLKTARYTVGYGPGFGRSVTAYYHPLALGANSDLLENAVFWGPKSPLNSWRFFDGTTVVVVQYYDVTL